MTLGPSRLNKGLVLKSVKKRAHEKSWWAVLSCDTSSVSSSSFFWMFPVGLVACDMPASLAYGTRGVRPHSKNIKCQKHCTMYVSHTQVQFVPGGHGPGSCVQTAQWVGSSVLRTELSVPFTGPPKLTATFVPCWRSWRYDLCSNRSVVVPSFHRSPKFDGPVVITK